MIDRRELLCVYGWLLVCALIGLAVPYFVTSDVMRVKLGAFCVAAVWGWYAFVLALAVLRLLWELILGVVIWLFNETPAEFRDANSRAWLIPWAFLAFSGLTEQYRQYQSDCSVSVGAPLVPR